MADQTQLFKGELMEEKLRSYFLNSGYYVVRGVKYEFESNEITDIDLFLYGRVSSLSRERTNVDIKNKKSPKAFERILWAKGLQALLGFDNCVVATTDRKEVIRKFGYNHNATVLDGSFLQKLTHKSNRLSEEELLQLLGFFRSFNQFRNQNWKNLYEKSKSRLLNELDFSGYNSTLILLQYFIKKCFDQQKRETALRATYIILSHSLLILDYILKDIAFLDQEKRKSILNDGFKYGNLGKEGVDKTIEMALRISNSTMSVSQIKKSIDSTEMDILKEYFSKVENIKTIFRCSISFENNAFNKELISPNNLDFELKSTLTIMLDYFKIGRKDFFELFA